MPAKKTIFVSRFFYPDHSANSQILSDLAFHLARKGEPVSVITSRNLYDDPDAELPAFEELNGVAIHRVCKPNHGRDSLSGRAIDYLTMYRSFAAAAWRISQRGDFLVAKTDPPLLSVALMPVAIGKGLALVNWLQDLYPEVALSLGVDVLRPAAPVLIAARNASLKAASWNVVIGEHMRRRLEALGAPSERIAVIANWSDDEAISPKASNENPLRKAWGLENKFVIGYSGNLGRAHEYATLLDAAEKLHKADGSDAGNFAFLFIGGGHLIAPLKEEVVQRGLEDMFYFQPYQDASLLPLSLSVPDVHWLSLLPALEGLIVPCKFYGIAAAGRPTIAIGDPCGEIGTLVRRYECGAALKAGDSNGLAELIRRWRQDHEKVSEMGRNARAMLEQIARKKDALLGWERILMGVGAGEASN